MRDSRKERDQRSFQMRSLQLRRGGHGGAVARKLLRVFLHPFEEVEMRVGGVLEEGVVPVGGVAVREGGEEGGE